ncbi:hypothetical protein [Cognatiluteimonas weifangensis]|uniref:Uncharacterized protein n=1 Tax=Cognatiluteimonas weifangensis TaxID=2303539 RepID=A0A372DL54_9GAMM|nr:hypothetical protein [Luteimonas weifangensis]RFP60293.1 hypothetical protein D0Y53_07945 [Luteimonas weifangensis]
MDTNKISLDPSALAWRLALVAMLLVAGNIVLQLFRLHSNYEYFSGLALVRVLVDLDGENTFPALFSTALLLSASALLALIARLERHDGARDAAKWTLLAIGFLLMGMDESLALHEHLIAPLRALLGGRQLGIFYFAWVIPGIVLVAVLGAYFMPFLWRLPRGTAIAFALAAAIYVGGALGVELVEGWWREGHGHRNAAYHLLVSLEEGMEMLGTILFIHALLRYLAGHHGEVRLRFDAATAMQPLPEKQKGQRVLAR